MGNLFDSNQGSVVKDDLPPLTIYLCSPRGFCAGVVRAIDIVLRTLAMYGPPVYVRHEIVHNKYVVESLKKKGAVFIQELDEIVDKTSPVIFSAHGVARSVPEYAQNHALITVDATCPLVTKVHREAELHFRKGRHVILIGHSGHPEVVGTMGQLPKGAITLVEDIAQIGQLKFNQDAELAWVTQTTLSVDDTKDMVRVLRERFPSIVGPHKDDICYATTNRQEAVKLISSKVDALIVVGSTNSSNSQRLREVAERAGCKLTRLLLRSEEIDWEAFKGIRTLGLTAGASAPEVLVEEMIEAFSERFTVDVETIGSIVEDMSFPLPRELRNDSSASSEAITPYP